MPPDPKPGDFGAAFGREGNYQGERGSRNCLIEYAKDGVCEEPVTGGSDADDELYKEYRTAGCSKDPVIFPCCFSFSAGITIKRGE